MLLKAVPQAATPLGIVLTLGLAGTSNTEGNTSISEVSN